MLPRRPAAPLHRLSIRLMLVRPHGPYRLERQHVLAARQIAVAVLAFQPEINELTLPPGEVWSDSPFRIIRPPRRLHIIIACAEDPALAGSRLQIQKRAIPVGGDADLIGMEAIPFGAEGDIAPGAGLRRSISEPEVESRNPAAEIGRGRVGKECRSRCDWSSDVCSSDLGMEAIPFGAEGDIAPGAGLRRSISEPEVESRNPAA